MIALILLICIGILIGVFFFIFIIMATESINNELSKLEESIANLETEFLQIDYFLGNTGVTGVTGVVGITGIGTINDLSGTGVSDLQEFLYDYRTTLAKTLEKFYKDKNICNCKLTNINNGFTANQQTMVDEINATFNNRYANNMNVLAAFTDTKKQQFFDMYNATSSTIIRERLIQSFISQYSKSKKLNFI